MSGNIFVTGDGSLTVGGVKYVGGTDAIFDAPTNAEIQLTRTRVSVRQEGKGQNDGGDSLAVTLQNDLDLSAIGLDSLVVTNNVNLTLGSSVNLVFGTSDTLQFNLASCSISNIDHENGAVTGLGGASVTGDAITSANWEIYTATAEVTLTGKTS